MKKKTVVITGVALLAVAAGVVALDLAGWPGLAPRLAERADFGLTLDDGARVHLLFNPRLEAPRLQVAGKQGETLADAHGVTLAWHWRDVWDWRHGAPLRVRVLHADGLALTWQRDAQGRTPWKILPEKDEAQAKPAQMPVIDHLVIRSGSASIDDAPLQLHGNARFATEADGRWTADLKGRLREQQLALNAQASAGLALLSSKESGQPPVKMKASLKQTEGSVSFDGTAASLLDARALDGELHVQGKSLAPIGRPFGVTLPETPPLDLRGRLRHESGIWQVNGINARIGQSRLGGDFAFDTTVKPRPMLSGVLRGGPLRLADLGPAVGADSEPSRKGRVLPDRKFDLPSLKAMDARVAVALSELDLGAKSLAPLTPVNTSLVLDNGVLSLDNFNAGIAGGEVAGNIRLDANPMPPRWQARADVRDMAIERWFKPQVKRVTADPLTGRVRAEFDVQGRGRSIAEVLGTLNGPMSARVEKGSVSHLLVEVAGLDVAQALGVLLKGDDHLPLNCVLLDGRFKDGVLRPRTAVVDNRDSRLDLDGRISLADESMDLRVVARPKDFSPLTLRAPLRVQGTFEDPHVALEGKALGGRALAAIALGALAPPAALLAFVDPGEKLPPLDCSAQRSRPTP